MKKLKLMTIVGTRPEIIKLSSFIPLADKHVDHVLVHTGQNYDYELNEIFFEELQVRKPDYFLEVSTNSVAEAIGETISKIDPVLESEEPDAILIYGDTNSCLSVISAKRRKIPIFHLEAGNRCFDQRVPEEINRKIVDHLSDINMPLSEHARRYLLDEGIKPETIIKIGSMLPEVIKNNFEAIENSKILKNLKLKKDKYFLVSIHREENVDSEDNFQDFLETIEVLTDVYELPIVISTHPRTAKRIEEINYKPKNGLVKFCKPFGYFDYNKLQMNSLCVISDSGTIAEESSILKLSSITIRQAHERPEASDEATFIMSGLKKDSVLEAIRLVTSYKKALGINSIKDYMNENTSLKVLRTILSYTHYVNRTVWKKP